MASKMAGLSIVCFREVSGGERGCEAGGESRESGLIRPWVWHGGGKHHREQARPWASTTPGKHDPGYPAAEWPNKDNEISPSQLASLSSAACIWQLFPLVGYHLSAIASARTSMPSKQVTG